jgi:ABC-type glycerol-3-phosphate transport system substrate-binding protein
VVEALEWCVDFYDHVLNINGPMPAGWPGFGDKRLAMAIDGSWGLNMYSNIPGLDFGITQPPYPEGGQPATWSCGYALCIPASIKAKKLDAAWKFIRYMSGVEGWLVKEEFDYLQTRKQWAGRKNAGDMEFVPADVICNVPAVNAIRDRFKDRLTPTALHRMKVAFDLLDVAYDCGNFSIAGQTYWNELDKAYWMAVNHKTTPQKALETCRAIVQQELDKMWKRVRVTK